MENGNQLIQILFIALIVMFAMNYFFPASNTKVTPVSTPQGVYLTSAQTDYIAPTIPTITINNHTSTPITLDTCRDISLQKDALVLSGGTVGFPHTFCRTVTVAAEGSGALVMDPLYRIFQSSGAFSVHLSLAGTDHTVAFTLSDPGALRLFFRTVFYAPIYNFFVFLLYILPGNSLGLAIITITIAIRLLLLVPQHHMLMSNRRLQEIQPKVREIQDLHKEDQSKLGMELMALYKREGVNPLGSCLPLLVQMPILIVLYSVILEITHIVNSYYLYPVLSGFDI